MKQRGRVVPPKPDDLNNWAVSNTLPTEEAWNVAEAHRTLDSHAIACGAAQHPDTGLWQVWVSLYGADLTQWAAFRTQSQATLWAKRIGRMFETANLDTPEQVADAIEQAARASDGEPQQLPDDMVREILRQVAIKAQKEEG